MKTEPKPAPGETGSAPYAGRVGRGACPDSALVHLVQIAVRSRAPSCAPVVGEADDRPVRSVRLPGERLRQEDVQSVRTHRLQRSSNDVTGRFHHPLVRVVVPVPR